MSKVMCVALRLREDLVAGGEGLWGPLVWRGGQCTEDLADAPQQPVCSGALLSATLMFPCLGQYQAGDCSTCSTWIPQKLR